MILTVDTGGTKTLIASFNDNGTIAKTYKFPTPKNVEEYSATLQHALRQEFSPTHYQAVSVGLPGIVKNGIALWCPNLGWKDYDISPSLRSIVGDIPIFVENDANLAGLSEAQLVQPAYNSVLYVTISTGIGAGVITNGAINPGMRLSEVGHMPIEYDGALKEWEQFASGRAIHDLYGKYAKEITSRADWHDIADRISRGFLALIPLIQPDIIILGGSVGGYFERYQTELETILRQKLPFYIPCPPFTTAKHPAEAVVYGGYHYAVNALASTQAYS